MNRSRAVRPARSTTVSRFRFSFREGAPGGVTHLTISPTTGIHLRKRDQRTSERGRIARREGLRLGAAQCRELGIELRPAFKHLAHDTVRIGLESAVGRNRLELAKQSKSMGRGHEITRGEVAGYYVKRRENVTLLSRQKIYANLQALVDAGDLRLPGSNGSFQ